MKDTQEGIISTNTKGFGFIRLPDETRIVVRPEFINTALPGDTVLYRITRKASKDFDAEAQIVSIAKRAKTEFVGTVVTQEKETVVRLDDRRIYVPFRLSPDAVTPEALGKKVLVKLEEWPDDRISPLCSIKRIIGTQGEHRAEMQSIILEKGVREEIPEAVVAEAERIGKTERTVSEQERTQRRDMSKIPTFTIDPIDAKDFDDAISIQEVKSGVYEIGVHIADVSHYVRPGTVLDDEAQRRATSIYMVDRVIPMLPEVLSNDLCSLNPHEERRTFSAIFEMNLAGDILSRWFGKTIINSHHRFTYESAQEVLDGKDTTFASELKTLNTIAYKLRERKFEAGAIDFDTQEVKFVLDEHGKPLKVVKKLRGDTHRLVEDFMLLANKEVAQYISNTHSKAGVNGTGMYRIHDNPDQDRLAELASLYKALGYNIGPVKTAKDIARALQHIEGAPEASLLKTATVRAMAKAIYATENSGHFGLAFEYYTHFTSPIRRYPDLEVHRILHALLTNKKTDAEREKVRLERIAAHSTQQEIVAADVERTSIKYKQVEYMSSRVGQTFTGTISGVTEWGIFIEEKETGCEGMVRLRDMTDDYYSFEERLYCIVGQKTKKKISLGDTVQFRVVTASLETRTLDYALV